MDIVCKMVVDIYDYGTTGGKDLENKLENKGNGTLHISLYGKLFGRIGNSIHYGTTGKVL